MRASLLLLLVACADPPAHTLGEAAELVARADCSRWISCGSLDGDWRECVDGLVLDFCTSHRCVDPYESYDYDEVEACADWFVTVSCSRYVDSCTL